MHVTKVRVGNFWYDKRTRQEQDTEKQGLGLALLGSGHNRVNPIMTRLY